MKRLIYLAGAVLLMVVISTISCTKDSEEADPLVGKWAGQTWRVTTYLNDTLYSINSGNSNPGDYMQINSDGTGKFFTNNVFSENFKWKVNENNMFIFTYSNGETSEREYTVNKTTLTLQLTDTEGTGNFVFKYLVYEVYSRK